MAEHAVSSESTQTGTLCGFRKHNLLPRRPRAESGGNWHGAADSRVSCHTALACWTIRAIASAGLAFLGRELRVEPSRPAHGYATAACASPNRRRALYLLRPYNEDAGDDSAGHDSDTVDGARLVPPAGDSAVTHACSRQRSGARIESRPGPSKTEEATDVASLIGRVERPARTLRDPSIPAARLEPHIVPVRSRQHARWHDGRGAAPSSRPSHSAGIAPPQGTFALLRLALVNIRLGLRAYEAVAVSNVRRPRRPSRPQPPRVMRPRPRHSCFPPLPRPAAARCPCTPSASCRARRR